MFDAGFRLDIYLYIMYCLILHGIYRTLTYTCIYVEVHSTHDDFQMMTERADEYFLSHIRLHVIMLYNRRIQSKLTFGFSTANKLSTLQGTV